MFVNMMVVEWLCTVVLLIGNTPDSLVQNYHGANRMFKSVG